MDLFEYQARDLFEAHGVPVLAGAVADDRWTRPVRRRRRSAPAAAAWPSSRPRSRPAAAARPAASSSPRPPTRRPRAAEQILGMDIKGHTVHRVMIAQGAQIAEEYYFSVLLDRANRTYLAMASRRAAWRSRSSPSSAPRPSPGSRSTRSSGIDDAKAREIVDAAGFDDDVTDQIADAIQKLWDVFLDEDATLVEVNPLVKTADGQIVALDGKVTLDENADFRHPDHAALEDKAAADPLEAAAKAKDLNYVKLDGAVGIIGNGAGPGHVDPRRRRLRRRGVHRPASSRRTSSTSAAAPRPR